MWKYLRVDGCDLRSVHSNTHTHAMIILSYNTNENVYGEYVAMTIKKRTGCVVYEIFNIFDRYTKKIFRLFANYAIS